MSGKGSRIARISATWTRESVKLSTGYAETHERGRAVSSIAKYNLYVHLGRVLLGCLREDLGITAR